MHTFATHLRSDRKNFIYSTIFAVAFAIGLYFVYKEPLRSVAVFAMVTTVNGISWFGKAWFKVWREAVATRQRLQWEERMHRALAMANEASKYYESESGTIMAAYHGHVDAVQREGFQKNYILKSLL